MSGGLHARLRGFGGAIGCCEVRELAVPVAPPGWLNWLARGRCLQPWTWSSHVCRRSPWTVPSAHLVVYVMRLSARCDLRADRAMCQRREGVVGRVVDFDIDIAPPRSSG